MFDAYREAAAQAGRPAGPEQLAIRRVVLCRHDELAARRLGRDVAEQFARFESLAEIVTDDDIIAGTPDQVTEQVLEQCSRTGAGHIVLFGSGHMPHADWAAMIDLFGLEVLPRLRESTVGAFAVQPAEA
jgi:alkanesulfonate monooxygenase SsuD/methylene tetrahydromethanopterin reductase-like flavin-dependent oxidoreductase (luciferase family)